MVYHSTFNLHGSYPAHPILWKYRVVLSKLYKFFFMKCMFTEDPRRNTKTEIYNNTFLHTEYEGRPSHYIKDIINGVDRSCFVVAEQPVQVTVCIASI